ncbi:preprotein translocase subunit YajC [uncultured Parasphingopyxis sp.]|uniref:preprotein translocase subunit YajC n=1 Tax=uncultured Parasphingopyxis sp. TaxID=1547918 RepID=UPI002621A96A|nr:preprotein translocase subunit YajC [uncultured Parasphingopyxis sp.]
MSISPVLASAAPSGGGATSLIVNILPLVLIFVIFWFLLIRPQQKRMKEHRDMITAVKRGDRVVTGGGLLGKVTKVMDEEVEIDLGGGQKVRAIKSTLSSVTGPNAGKAAND